MKAQCLCGAVSLEVEHNRRVHACHCGMCKTWGSGAYFAVDALGAPKIEGSEYISIYRSSDWNERCFCKQCGTHLFCHLIPSDGYAVNAGLFKNEALHLDMQFFSDLQPAYYQLENQSKVMTEAEVMNQFRQP